MSSSVSHQPAQLSLRDMEPRDLRSILKIERSSFEEPWSEDDFYRTLSQKHRVGIVAVASKRTVVGYLIAESMTKSFQVLNMAVSPTYRGRGVGRVMLGWLCDQLVKSSRDKVRVEVRETNLPMQLFLRRVGFLATEVLRSYYPDTKEDAFQFEKMAREERE